MAAGEPQSELRNALPVGHHVAQLVHNRQVAQELLMLCRVVDPGSPEVALREGVGDRLCAAVSSPMASGPRTITPMPCHWQSGEQLLLGGAVEDRVVGLQHVAVTVGVETAQMVEVAGADPPGL